MLARVESYMYSQTIKRNQTPHWFSECVCVCVFVSSGSVPARHVSFLHFTTPSPSLSPRFVAGESVSRASRARQAIASPAFPSWHCALRFSVASARVKNNSLKKSQSGCRTGGLPHTFSAFALLQICIRTPVAR